MVAHQGAHAKVSKRREDGGKEHPACEEGRHQLFADSQERVPALLLNEIAQCMADSIVGEITAEQTVAKLTLNQNLFLLMLQKLKWTKLQLILK